MDGQMVGWLGILLLPLLLFFLTHSDRHGLNVKTLGEGLMMMVWFELID
jgi:hypothetical protein